MFDDGNILINLPHLSGALDYGLFLYFPQPLRISEKIQWYFSLAFTRFSVSGHSPTCSQTKLSSSGRPMSHMLVTCVMFFSFFHDPRYFIESCIRLTTPIRLTHQCGASNNASISSTALALFISPELVKKRLPPHTRGRTILPDLHPSCLYTPV